MEGLSPLEVDGLLLITCGWYGELIGMGVGPNVLEDMGVNWSG